MVQLVLAVTLESYTPYYTPYYTHPLYSCTIRSYTVYNTVSIRLAPCGVLGVFVFCVLGLSGRLVFGMLVFRVLAAPTPVFWCFERAGGCSPRKIFGGMR